MLFSEQSILNLVTSNPFGPFHSVFFMACADNYFNYNRINIVDQFVICNIVPAFRISFRSGGSFAFFQLVHHLRWFSQALSGE